MLRLVQRLPASLALNKLAINGTFALPKTPLPRYEVLHEKLEALDEKRQGEKMVEVVVQPQWEVRI